MPDWTLDNPQRFLIVKPSALGDIVHALPVAALLKRRWPQSHLSWLVSRPFAPLLETNPHVDALIGFDRARGTGLLRHSGNARQLARQLRDGCFDVVIDLQGLFRSGWLTWQSRAPVRIGFAYARESAPIFYTHRIPAASVGHNDRHAVDRYLDITDALGCGREPVEFPLITTADDDAEADALLAPLNGRSPAILLPGTNWPTKRWPAESFAELSLRIQNELSLPVVIAGANDAVEAAALIRERNPDVLNVTNRTTVRSLVALLRRAALVVCNDSGPMHLAAALHRPLVAPFGPTSPLRTGPYGAEQATIRLDIVCSPCFERHCVHQSCLQQLSVDAVLAHCRTALAFPDPGATV